MNDLTILPGRDKDLCPEGFSPLCLKPGDLCAIVGNTGSGKSRLIKDIEQLAWGDSVTGRRILLDGRQTAPSERLFISGNLVAHLSQNMRFVLDLTIRDFLTLHCRCRGRENLDPQTVTNTANTITPEPVHLDDSLNLLSGGQSRALMIADMALACDSPIVLIDEIENAGIDKKKALQLLTGTKKLVLIVTHDPHTALMASKRLIMQNGAICGVRRRTPGEKQLFASLDQGYEKQMALQLLLRKGEYLS